MKEVRVREGEVEEWERRCDTGRPCDRAGVGG